jgi:hypothetical protein
MNFFGCKWQFFFIKVGANYSFFVSVYFKSIGSVFHSLKPLFMFNFALCMLLF